MQNSKKTLVYDWPTRVFHWVFGALFLGAFFIAKTMDDDSPIYPVHMMLGMTMLFAVFLRVVWGVVGSRYARFSGFALNPRKLLEYGKSLITSKTQRELGHNPASSWAAIIMMILALGSVVTGVLMVNGIAKDTVEEIHEVFANTFVVVVISHIAGVVFHTIRHRELIGLSMITGTKDEVSGEEGILRSYPVIGLLIFVAIGLFAVNLYSGYDQTTHRLKAFGVSLQLGEDEQHEAQD